MDKKEILYALRNGTIDLDKAKSLLSRHRNADEHVGGHAGEFESLIYGSYFRLSANYQAREDSPLVLVNEQLQHKYQELLPFKVMALPGVNSIADLQSDKLQSHRRFLIIFEAGSVLECEQQLARLFSFIKSVYSLAIDQILLACHGEFARVLSEAIAGVAQVLRLEKPDFRLTVLHTENLTTEWFIKALVNFSGQSWENFSEVAYLNQCFYQKILVETSETGNQDQAAGVSFREGGVYLITGGAGGIGLQFARYLADKYHATVIITGRKKARDVPGEKWAEYSDNIHYYSADISDEKSVQTLLQHIKKQHTSLQGIIHAAGVLADSYIANSDPENLKSVLGPKLSGSYWLDRYTREFALDFFAYCSSLATFMPNLGQASYAAANKAMAALAQMRKQQGGAGKTIVLHWPLWEQGGMTIAPEEKASQLRLFGISPMPTECGIGSVEQLFSSTEWERWYLFGEVDRLRKLVEQVNNPGLFEIKPLPACQLGRQEIEDFLIAAISEVTELPWEKIHPEQKFEHFGFDSLLINKLNAKLDKRFAAVSKTVFFEFQTIKSLCDYLLTRTAIGLPDQHYLADPRKAASHNSQETAENKLLQSCPAAGTGTAIVGIAGRFPGAANIEELWRNLEAGVDCITEIPVGRWPLVNYHALEMDGKALTAGGFLDDIDKFDHFFFGISPKDAEQMDPQERIFLQVVWHALEQGGYSVEKLHRQSSETNTIGKVSHNVGVYVGVAAGQYALLVARHQPASQPVCAQSSSWSVANRVSFFFDLHGPSVSVDTACSSSMTALNLACDALARGEINIAIVGGISLNLDPLRNKILSAAHMLSSDRRCRSFGANGDGFVPGEGVCALVLKRQANAENDGDNIQGIIRGISINHGGRTNGYTVPNPLAHSSLIGDALKKAGVDPHSISYIEAHGTGTALGDPIEINGLQHLFGGSSAKPRSCAIGSIKSNIGHLEPAAALAGLTKILLQFKSGKIFPSLHAEIENPNIHFAGTSFYIPKVAASWITQSRHPRRAALSSFGAGGSNGHLIVEEYLGQERRHAEGEVEITGPQLLFYSAMSEQPLKILAQEHLLRITHNHYSNSDFRNYAFMLRTAREHLDFRLAFIANSYSEAAEKLALFTSGEYDKQDSDGIFLSHITDSREFIAKTHTEEEFRELLTTKNWQGLRDKWLVNGVFPWHLEAGGAIADIDKFPHYPFEKKSSWFFIPDPLATNNRSKRYPVNFTLCKNEKSTKVIFTVNPAMSLLAQHKVHNKLLVAGTLQLEWVRAACAAAGLLDSAASGFSFKNVVLIKQLAVNAEIEIQIDLQVAGDEILFEVSTSAVHSRGRLAGVARDILSPEWLSLQAEYSHEILYDAFDRAGYQYGRLFRGITAIAVQNDRAFSHIGLSVTDDERSGNYPEMFFHPGLVDAGLQSTSVLYSSPDLNYLPYSVEEILVKQSGKKIARAIAVKKEADEREQRFDVYMLSEDNQLCVAWLNFCCRVLVPEIAKPKVDASSQLYLPVWQVIEDEKLPPVSSEEEYPAEVLVFASRANLEAIGKLVSSLSSRSGPEIVVVSPELKESDYSGILSHSNKKITEVLFCPGIALHSYDYLDVKEVDLALENTLYSLLRLAKAILKLDKKALELTIVTNNLARINPFGTDEGNPLVAGLIGFTRSLAREFSWLKVRHIDFCKQDLHEAIARRNDYFKHALRRANIFLPESMMAVRQNNFYKESFTQVPSGSFDEPANIKHQGVYLIIGGAGGLGIETAKYLMQNYNAEVIVTGRREEQELLPLKRLPQGRVHYRCVDITDRNAVARFAESLRSEFGQLNGVFHSALVLDDQSIGNMDEVSMSKVLAPKTYGVVNLFAYIAPLCTDAIVLYSSAISKNGTAGQSNYAAASTFEDIYACCMADRFQATAVGTKVYIINWGFWRDVGIVASEKYRRAFAEKGITGLSTSDGMAIVTSVLQSNIRQVITGSNSLVENRSNEEKLPCAFRRHLECYWQQLDIQDINLGAVDDASDVLQDIVNRTLLLAFQQRGMLQVSGEHWYLSAFMKQLEVTTDYQHLFTAVLNILADAGFITFDSEGIRVSDVPQISAEEVQLDMERLAVAHEDTRPMLDLLKRCVEHLLQVVSAKISYTEVMFPRGSDHLVAGLYRGNPGADLFNSLVKEGIASFIDLNLERKLCANRPLKILEIGAGTGGTTQWLLPLVEKVNHQVIYDFTDISSSFVNKAKERFANYPFVQYSCFDIENTAQVETCIATYDIIVATNVLHATRRLQPVIDHCYKMLAPNGVFIVNEASARKDAMTLTFGLASGWWLFEDKENRIEHSPLATPQQWQILLQKAGFTDIDFFGDTLHNDKFGHLVYFAWRLADHPIKPMTRVADYPAHEATGKTPARVSQWISAGKTSEAARSAIRSALSELQKIPLTELDDDIAFDRYGVDSIVALQLLDKLQVDYNCSIEAINTYRTIADLAAFLEPNDSQIDGAIALAITDNQQADAKATNEKFQPVSENNNDLRCKDIAIIGLSGRYPGASSLDQFWNNLRDGHIASSATPVARWEQKEQMPDGMSLGCYLSDIDSFDSLFFNIPPRDAQRMDPQERLLMETCWSAIEDAGYTPEGLNRSTQKDGNSGVGVFVSTMYGHYELIAADHWSQGKPAAASSAYYALANNISRVMDFRGPSMTVDTACSSALTALHLAIQNIASGDCHAAIVGGVNLVLHPSHLASLDAMKMLSRQGECRIFSDAADGFLAGEGVGVFLIKPLRSAERDGDNIYACIKSTAVNNNGSSVNAVPSVAAQVAVINKALQKAGKTPGDIQYIEAQSTGSKLGDKAEIDALNRIFGAEPHSDKITFIGSLKPNIGHLEAAAGMAQLTKVILQIKNGILLKTILDNDNLRKDIDFNSGRLQIVKENREWNSTSDKNLCAGISSFGAGGSNVHIIVEGYQKKLHPVADSAFYIFPLSARKGEILRDYAKQLHRFLRETPDVNPASLSFVAQTGRVPQKHRICIVFQRVEQLIERLASFLQNQAIEDVAVGFANKKSAPDNILPSSMPEKEMLIQIASAWVQGAGFDWAALYKNETPPKIALPTYPFESVRHWFAEPVNDIPIVLINTESLNNFNKVPSANKESVLMITSADQSNQPQEFSQAAVNHLVRYHVGQVLKMPLEEISLDDALSEFGFDSISLTELVESFTGQYALEMDVTVFFEHHTLGSFAEYLFAEQGDKLQAKPEPAVINAGLLQPSVSTQPVAEPVRVSEIIIDAPEPQPERQAAAIPAIVATSVQPLDQAAVDNLVKRHVGQVLKMPLEEISLDDALSEFGFDSISLTELVESFTGQYALEMDVTVFFEHHTLGSFAEYLFAEHGDKLQANPEAAVINAGLLQPSVSSQPVAEPVRVSEIIIDAPEPQPERQAATIPAIVATSVQPLDQAAVDNLVKRHVGQVLKMPLEEISLDDALSEFGFDSISLTELVESFTGQYAIEMDVTVFFEHHTLGSFAEYLFAEYGDILLCESEAEPAVNNETYFSGVVSPIVSDGVSETGIDLDVQPIRTEDPKPLQKMVTESPVAPVAPHIPRVRDKDVAVIGMAGQFPGGSSLEEFWENLCAGQTAFSKLPERRIEDFNYYGYAKTVLEMEHFFRGGFLEDFDKFDPLFFKISPVEARTIDPQQRLLLEAAWSCVEDAGYNPTILAGSLTGVFVGVAASEYAQILMYAQIDSVSRDFTGTLYSAHANRISFALDLQGPSESIDTACSSSLVALHRAVQSIRTGESEVALAGGVNVILGCAAFLLFGASGMLAKDGLCKSFDASADGYIRGEGVGMVMLKPLSKAIADKDNIRAVIKGTAIRHGGHATSMTAPNSLSQTKLIQQALADAELSPHQIGHIEAHGTGTKIGDPIEINALKKVFLSTPSHPYQCAIGTVKSNIGHLETAAGIAGFIKTIFVLERGIIPQLATLKTPNEMIKIEDTPLYLANKKHQWSIQHDETGDILPRVAGISSFGIGGVLVHMVVQDAEEFTSPAIASVGKRVITISARSAEQLTFYSDKLLQHLQKHPTCPLHDVAMTLLYGRETFSHRLAVVANDVQDLAFKLNKFLQGHIIDDVFVGVAVDDNTVTEANRESLQAALENKDLLTLSASWVKGTLVSWPHIWCKRDYKKQSLPTYPFARESHMVPEPVYQGYETKTESETASHNDKTETLKQGDPSQIKSSQGATDPAGFDKTLQHIIHVFSEVMHIPVGQLHPGSKLADFGVDSLSGLRIMQRLQHDYGDELAVAAILSNPSLNDLSEYIFDFVNEPGREATAVKSPTLSPHKPAVDVVPNHARQTREDIISIVELMPGKLSSPLVVLCATTGELSWVMHWLTELAAGQKVVGIELANFQRGTHQEPLFSIDTFFNKCLESISSISPHTGVRIAAFGNMAKLAGKIAASISGDVHQLILVKPETMVHLSPAEQIAALYRALWDDITSSVASVPLFSSDNPQSYPASIDKLHGWLRENTKVPMPDDLLREWLLGASNYIAHFDKLLLVEPLISLNNIVDNVDIYDIDHSSLIEAGRIYSSAKLHLVRMEGSGAYILSSIAPKVNREVVVSPISPAKGRHMTEPTSNKVKFVSLNTRGSFENLVCFPTLYGDVGYAATLSLNLGQEFPMSAIEQWNGSQALACNDLKALASHCVDCILESNIAEPYNLLGLSFGGIIAYESCYQLQLRGKQVNNLILLDPYMPNTAAVDVFNDLQLEVDGKDLNQIGLAGIIFGRWRVSEIFDYNKLNNLPEVAQIELMARHMAQYSAMNISLEQARDIINSHFNIDRANRFANKHYHPRPLAKETHTLMISASEGFFNPNLHGQNNSKHHFESDQKQIVVPTTEPSKGFRNYLNGPFKLIEMPTDHLSMPLHLNQCAAFIKDFLLKTRGAPMAQDNNVVKEITHEI